MRNSVEIRYLTKKVLLGRVKILFLRINRENLNNRDGQPDRSLLDNKIELDYNIRYTTVFTREKIQ